MTCTYTGSCRCVVHVFYIRVSKLMSLLRPGNYVASGGCWGSFCVVVVAVDG